MELLSLFGQVPDYSYDTTYVNPQTVEAGAIGAGVVLFSVFFGLLAAVVAYVISSLCLSRIFKKAGIEGWRAWVPIYNTWIMLELGGQQGFWAVLMLIPVVNIVAAVFMFIAMYYIGLQLGKSGAFVLLAIFLPIVWLIWLAVDDSTWKGAKMTKAAPAPKVSDTTKQT